jgi:AraC-like DNA-binding protein
LPIFKPLMESAGILRYFYLLGFANALFFSILIFSKPKRNLADKLLAWWLIVLSLHLFLPFLYLSDIKTYYRYAGFEIVFYAVHPLLLYLYINAIIGQFPSRKKILYLISTTVIVELTILSFFLFPASERLDMILGAKPIEPYVYLLCIPISALFVYYLIVSLKTLKDYKSNVLHIYSYKEDVDLLWLRRLVLLFYGILLLSLPLVMYFTYNNISVAFGDYFYFAGLALFIFFLGYWGYKQGEVFSFKEDDKNIIIENSNSINNKISNYNVSEEKVSELKRVMDRNKPYLNPALTIYELAKLVDIQPHQLSKLISHEFKCNFFEFINQYRIDIFKKYIFDSKYKDYTLLAVALECGFNSKSAFNRIFKEQTGQTPTEFKKNLLSSEVLKN